MQLLERESSLASLAGYAQEARRGEGRLVLVAGEAGSASRRWWKHSSVTCRGRAGPGGHAMGCLPPSARAAVRPGCPAWRGAAGVVPGPGWPRSAVRRAAAPGEQAGDAGRGGGGGRSLGRRGDPGHVAVRSQADQDAGVLLIATYRDEDLAAGDPLRVVLGELARQRSTRRVELAPLSAGAVRQLAAPAGLDAAELYRLTGGNPFYVTAVIAGRISRRGSMAGF